MNTFTLTDLELKVLNKLGLKKENIFSPQRLEARTIVNDNNKEEQLDAVTYINVRGYTQDNATLSMKIYPSKWDIAFFVSSDTGEIDAQTNKKIFDDRQVTSTEFKELLAGRKDNLTESIDSL